MKLNNKGIAITSTLYIILVLAIILIASTLAMLSNRKFLLDKLKSDVAKSDKEICIPVTEDTKTVGNVPEGKYEPGDEYICEVKKGTKYHFAILSKENSSLNLIMVEKNDELFRDGVAWNSSGKNSDGPTNVLKVLNEKTSDWSYIQDLDEKYKDEGGNYGVINLTGKARLATLNEIQSLTNISFITETMNINWPTEYMWLLSSYSGTIDSAYTLSVGGMLNSNSVTSSAWSDTFSIREYVIKPVINISLKKIYTPIKDGTVKYFNVRTGKACRAQDYIVDNSITGYNGTKSTQTTPAQNGCLKFYVFNDDGGNTVNLILDHNTTDYVAWNSSGSNLSGPNEVLTKLKSDTSSWLGTITPTNYEPSGLEYTIDYSGSDSDSAYKARLITAEEIAEITNNNSFDKTSWFYLDGASGTDDSWHTQIANSTNKSKYYWLYDRTKDCKNSGCSVEDANTNGYWTATAKSNETNKAFSVGFTGIVNNPSVGSTGNASSTDYSRGVRPVIEVERGNLKIPEIDSYSNGEVVYFDVLTGYKCTNYIKYNSNTDYNGVTGATTSTQNSCLKFYVFNDDGDTVNLILDHNTTNYVKWNESGKNSDGPTTILPELKSDTASWQGTLTPFGYSGYKARLITVPEIAKITGLGDGFDGKTPFYFDSNTETPSTTCTEGNTTGCNYGWLYDRTNSKCKTYGCYINLGESTKVQGYWTATANSDTTDSAWAVGYYGRIASNKVTSTTAQRGVRPVIEVERYRLKDPSCKATSGTGKNIGDIVSCGDESFYVVNNNGENIEMLAKNNITLDTVTPLQSSSAGTTKFADKPYFISISGGSYILNLEDYYSMFVYDSNSTLYQYVNAYQNYLKNKLGISSASATIMTKAQYDSIKSYSWATSSSYWLGTFASSVYGQSTSGECNSSYTTNNCPGTYLGGCCRMQPYVLNVYLCTSDGNKGFTGKSWNSFVSVSSFTYTYDKSGVRPLVTISTSELK